MIYYFNPGHETAILTESKHYQAPNPVKKMQEDLSFLPAWYADYESIILTRSVLPKHFMDSIRQVDCNVLPVSISELGNYREILSGQKVDLWGISPQAIHFFETISKKHDLNLQIPTWKPIYKNLSSRFFSVECLAHLIENIPEISGEILPVFYSDIDEIRKINESSLHKLLIKSPFSSSGRGLLWLEETTISRSSEQIIRGMLKKQKIVSTEKVLNKTMDFSMHFCENRFIGYSLFTTNVKGAYEKTLLASQERIITEITSFIDPDLLEKVKMKLISFFRETIFPDYSGNIGVDMMIYQSEGKYFLHPCVEINLRKSMGYLAIVFFEKYVHPHSHGYFSIGCNRRDEIKKTPLFIENNRIKEGFFPLCPINDRSDYQAIALLNAP